MDEEKVLELARAAGFDSLDVFGLGTKEQICVDTYECTDKILAFARLVAAAERERVSAAWESAHGFDKHGAAEFIRSRTE